MKRRVLCLIGLLLVTGAATLGNVPPTMEDQYVTTVQDTPVTFELRAQDEDIDPTDPDAHPLRFVLLEGPENGVLIGDLGAVWYEGPHDALIELTYVPAAGFVGTDRVTMAVFDPFDETATGTVTILIDVTARRAMGLLSGNWTCGMTYIPQSGSISAFQTQLTEVYRIGQLTVQGIASWGMTSVGGVENVTFNALRLVGDVKFSTMTVSSTLAFDPDATSPADLFDYWRTTVGFALQGVSFRHTFYLTQPVTSSYQSLYARGTIGGLSFTNTLRFDVNDTCNFTFGRNDASIGWSWCGLRLYATLAVTCDGFEEAVLKVNDLILAPGYLPGLTLDSQLTYTVEKKTVSATLGWRPGRMGCIRAYGELRVDGGDELEVTGVSIYGLRVEYDVGDVKVVSAMSLDPAKNSVLTGQSDYFEVLRASGTLTGCCSGSGSWGLATYFHAGSDQLFDWGMTTGGFDLALNDRMNVDFEFVYRSGELGDPRVELSFGWVVRW